MSRRPSVLENYRVPDLTNPINPLAAHEMVSRERMHGQELEQSRAQQKAKGQEDRDKAIDEMFKPNPALSGTIYDPTGLKALQDLSLKAKQTARDNPNLSASQIQAMYAPEANAIAQYFQKAKTIRLGTEAAMPDLNKLGGYNTAEIGDKSIRMALIDPATGKIREDVATVDETQPWWAKSIEAFPMETTTNQGLIDFVTKAETTPIEVSAKRVDKNRGLVSDKLTLTVPSFIQIEKDDKGNAIEGKNGTYQLEPKFEKLPDGTKILDEGTFKLLKSNSPSTYQRLKGEVAQYIKSNNDETDDNIALDSVEAENIMRALVYKDIKQVWGNKGVKKQDVVVQPPAPRITINNNTGGNNSQAIYNDTWGRIRDKYFENKQKKIDELKSISETHPDIGRVERDQFLISMSQLDTDAINLMSNQVNVTRKDEDKISPDDMYVNFTPSGEIKIYKAKKERGEDGKIKKVGSLNKEYLIATLPPSSNLKTPQANSKAKVSAQGEAKQRENEIKGNKSKIYKIGGREFTEEQLQKGADKNKMSLADYKKSIGL